MVLLNYVLIWKMKVVLRKQNIEEYQEIKVHIMLLKIN